MTILLTGGTGKTSLLLTKHLTRTSTPFILASRSAGKPGSTPSTAADMPAVHFDWLDPSTHDNPFRYQAEHMPGEEGKISAVYLIAPVMPEPAPVMNAFVDMAVQKYGVRRFVFMTGSTTQKGDRFVGGVWTHLMELGVEWCVLRATWFMGGYCS
jgi:festuclavine dehydrogenase